MSAPEAVYAAISRLCGDGHTVTIWSDKDGAYAVSVLCKGHFRRQISASGETIAEAFASAEREYFKAPLRGQR